MFFLFTYRVVRFTYDFVDLDSFDEGLEVSFRQLNGNWIPIGFYSEHNSTNRNHEISLGDINDGQLTIRGYPVTFTVAESQSNNEAIIRLCGENVFGPETEDELFQWRFRWLQTALKDDNDDTDVIHIDNITIDVFKSDRPEMLTLFEADFEMATERYLLLLN